MDQRVFTAARPVRGGDVTIDGRLRLDALARYLQDAAEDDAADADFGEPYSWVLRRCAVGITSFPRLGQRLAVRTFCSGVGARWAERTTTLAGDGGEMVRATAVWVAIAAGSGRPCPLGPEFYRVYGPSAAGRTVSCRLSHPRPPSPGGSAASGDGSAPWPLRATDFDASGHVNNTIHWAAVEDALSGLGWLPSGAEIEYPRPVLPGARPRLLTASPAEAEAWVWLLEAEDSRQPLASVRLTR
jgi:acyl-ACP thioesterase